MKCTRCHVDVSPAGVPVDQPGIPVNLTPLTTTTRERFEKAHAQSTCKSCHQAFEPFGFALESFDEMGRYRATENGIAINAAASAGPELKAADRKSAPAV